MTISRLLALFLITLPSLSYSNMQSLPTDKVQLFYYLWYGNPETDGSYKHWDHEVLPHWTESVNDQYKDSIGKKFTPPENLHSPYYPMRGPYSSMDSQIIKEQFHEILSTGSNAIVASWWGQSSNPYSTDTQGICTDKVIEHLLQTADEYHVETGNLIQIIFHLEPYHGRSVESVRTDIVYIIDKYSQYKSFYRTNRLSKDVLNKDTNDTVDISIDVSIDYISGIHDPLAADKWNENEKLLPMIYVYDSYHISPDQWGRLLAPTGDLTIRNSVYDAVVIGLWLDHNHGSDLSHGGFDGIYTYFATDGFSYGSSSRNWKHMCEYSKAHNMLCILSVGPGYDDTGIRPWNSQNTRSRRYGRLVKYGRLYEEMWFKAIAARPDRISITSYNEWGEGTQIEPAIHKNTKVIGRDGTEETRIYQYYESFDGDREGDPYLYLNITAKMTDLFST